MKVVYWVSRVILIWSSAGGIAETVSTIVASRTEHSTQHSNEEEDQQELTERDLLVGGQQQYVDKCFDGPTILDTNLQQPLFRPSPKGAAGPESLIAVVNTNVFRYDRDGNEQESINHETFFDTAIVGSVTNAHVVYDPHDGGRFVLCAVQFFAVFSKSVIELDSGLQEVLPLVIWCYLMMLC